MKIRDAPTRELRRVVRTYPADSTDTVVAEVRRQAIEELGRRGQDA